MVKIGWTDASGVLGKGFKYLYLDEAELKSLPADAACLHSVTLSEGTVCHRTDAIFGMTMQCSMFRLVFAFMFA